MKIWKYFPMEALGFALLCGYGFYLFWSAGQWPSSLAEFLTVLSQVWRYLLVFVLGITGMIAVLQIATLHKVRKSAWNELARVFADREIPEAMEWVLVTVRFGQGEETFEHVIVQANNEGMRFSHPWYEPPWSQGLLQPFFLPWAKIAGIEEWVWAASPWLLKVPGFAGPMIRLSFHGIPVTLSLRKPEGMEFFKLMPKPVVQHEDGTP